MSPSGITVRTGNGQIAGALLPQSDPSAPLVVCIPGGGCSGRYFSAARQSTAAMAHAHGFAVLLVDRPGYGASPPIKGSSPIADSLPHIGSLIAEACEAAGAPSDIGLIGHSIGGAIALIVAAAPDDLPLRAVAVSGIGDTPPPATRTWAASRDAPKDAPDFTASLFFGPPETYDWRGPAALRRAAEPWRMPEVIEIVERWPRRWPEIAARIRLPVHLRLSDCDGIWESGPDVVPRMKKALSTAPVVDAEALHAGGHAYEFHLAGPSLVRDQLAFLQRAFANRL